MVRDWKLVPPKLRKGSWNSLINDFVELSPYYVRKNSGEDLLQTVAAYYPERKICVPPGAYITDEPLCPIGADDEEATILGTKEGIIEGCGERTIMKAAAGVSPTVKYAHYHGHTAYAQSRPVLRDICIDANGNQDALELDNVKHGEFEHLLLKNFTRYGHHSLGQTTTSSGHSYWNLLRDVRVSTGACTAALCAEKNAIDNFYEHIWGTANGVGFLCKGDGGHILRDIWLVDVINEIKLHAIDDDIYDITIQNARVDTPTDHGISMELNNHSITRVKVLSPHFFKIPLAKDNFNFIGFAEKGFAHLLIDCPDDDTSIPRWNYNWDGIGAFPTTNKIRTNKLTLGSSGKNNNVPAGCFICED